VLELTWEREFAACREREPIGREYRFVDTAPTLFGRDLT
jgi:hypothetical protein